VTDNKRDFSNLNFEGFSELAQAAGLSKYEKIGFPNSYREGFEQAIFEDILAKLPRLASERGLKVVDVGPGCSDLPRMLIQFCQEREHELTLIDNAPMLAQLPGGSNVIKVEGAFPKCEPQISHLIGKTDVAICYSVLHYMYVDSNLFDCIDLFCRLLSARGRLLIGDIPNVSMRNRLFSSESGKSYHRQYTQSDTDPPLRFNQVVAGDIDDGVLMGLLLRVRASGSHAYLLPQRQDLPMANRREDLLIEKP
jgi:hypothetical protein